MTFINWVIFLCFVKTGGDNNKEEWQVIMFQL